MNFKPMKPAMLAAVATLCAGLLSAKAAETPILCVATGRAIVPFVIVIEKEQHQALLDKLAEAQVGIDKEAIIKNLAQRLNSEKIVPGEGQTLEGIATELFDSTVLPILAPRVEKFNDVMNKSVSEDSVSAGFIAFTGLAKSMAREKSSYPSIMLHGAYDYVEGKFDQGGEWEWSRENMITGTTKINASLNADIDEDIEFDLNSYGKKHTFNWNFSCSGEVTMEQTYDCKILGHNIYQGTPETKIRVRPSSKVVATKTISAYGYFSVTGKRRAVVEETFPHAAIHEIAVTAEKVDY